MTLPYSYWRYCIRTTNQCICLCRSICVSCMKPAYTHATYLAGARAFTPILRAPSLLQPLWDSYSVCHFCNWSSSMCCIYSPGLRVVLVSRRQHAAPASQHCLGCCAVNGVSAVLEGQQQLMNASKCQGLRTWQCSLLLNAPHHHLHCNDKIISCPSKHKGKSIGHDYSCSPGSGWQSIFTGESMQLSLQTAGVQTMKS